MNFVGISKILNNLEFYKRKRRTSSLILIQKNLSFMNVTHGNWWSYKKKY